MGTGPRIRWGQRIKDLLPFKLLSVDSVQIASHKIIFVFMQKFSMFPNSIKLHLVLSVTTRHRAF